MTAQCPSGNLLAIDPGDEGDHPVSTLAYYAAGHLVGLAEYNTQTAQITMLAGTLVKPDLIAIEKPRIYPNGHPRPQNIVNLAWAGGQALLAARLAYGCTFREYEPRAWKGQVKKPPHHHRFWQVLAAPERLLFPNDTYARIHAACQALGRTGKVEKYSWRWHNALDAAALGAFVLGRTK